MRNLNIKSDEAYELASDIARRTGKNLTLVVTDALRETQRLLTRDERLAKLEEIAKACKGKWVEPWKSTPHGDLLYDEDGLPK
jgi:antitoxin VapB